MDATWLIISYHANEDGVAASHHLDDRLPWLSRKGVNVVLLSSWLGGRNSMVRHVRVPGATASGWRGEIRTMLRRRGWHGIKFKFMETALLWPLAPLYLLEKMLRVCPHDWAWSWGATPLAWWLCLRHRPDVIYSTGGPPGAHGAAAKVARHCKIPWLAEFQDPLPFQYPRESLRPLVQRTENLAGREARAVVMLTRAAAMAFGDRQAGHTTAPIAHIYAGANPRSDSQRPLRRGRFQLAHFGSLGGSRGLRGLLAGWRQLYCDAPEMAAQLQLHLYGGADAGVLRQIEEFSALRFTDDPVVQHGLVQRETALTAMQECDALLLIQHEEALSAETIPSKAYEYLQAQRPVVALTYRNPELAEMLISLDHQAAEQDDPTAIARAMAACLEGSASSPLPCPYTVEHAVERLIRLAQ